MKKLPPLVVILIYIINFCAGFIIVFKIMTPYIEAKNTRSIENNPDLNFGVLVFTEGNIQILKLSRLESLRRQTSDFSFLVPKDQEKFYSQKLTNGSDNVIFEIQVEQILPEKQLISVSSDDIRSIVRNTYEATDKEIFPKTTMSLNMRYTPINLLVSAFGGAIVCLIFFFFYRKS